MKNLYFLTKLYLNIFFHCIIKGGGGLPSQGMEQCSLSLDPGRASDPVKTGPNPRNNAQGKTTVVLPNLGDTNLGLPVKYICEASWI